MPLYDMECEGCGEIYEVFTGPEDKTGICNICGGVSHRVYLKFGGLHESPNWMKDTIQVVNPDGGRHCQEFMNEPNRKNYKNWLKGEGLRPIEEGEKLRKPDPNERKKWKKEMHGKIMDNFKKRESITVGGKHA